MSDEALKKFSPDKLDTLLRQRLEDERDRGVGRKDRQWAYSRVAARLKVDSATLRNWRNGNTMPNADEFLALCFVLGVEPEELSDAT